MKKSTVSLSTYVLRWGIILYPAYFILDWFVYPRQKFTMLAIRVGEAAFLFALQALFPRMAARLQYPALFAGFFVASLGISLMCIIGGEGFSSPYYVGILQILVASTLFTSIPKGRYTILTAVIMVQHFVLLFFVPWTLNGLLVNVFGIFVFAVVTLFAHNFLYDLSQENKELRGILPICARCKKIRDDAGYWNEVATYIKAHSDVQFSHGICPQCLKELYPDLAEDVLKESGGSTGAPTAAP